MARNPMQRKAQNSFLLGMLITLLITGAIIAFLILQLTKITNEQKAEENKLKIAYVLSKDINSGDTISEDKLQATSINSDIIPNNAITGASLSTLSNIFDEDGNLIKFLHLI